MNWLIKIMCDSGWGFDRTPWFCISEERKVIGHAHRLGLVYQGSYTQVHWAEKGAALAKKYYYKKDTHENKNHHNN